MARSLTPTPGCAKEARGSEASRQGRRLFSQTPFAMRRECVVAQLNPTPGSAKEARGSGKPSARVGGFFREHLSPCDESAWWHSLTQHPEARKRRGGAGSQPPGSEAFFANTFRHATGDGQLGPFHAGSPLFMPSLHAMKPVPSAPLCRYCAQIDPFLYSGVQDVMPIDGAIRLSQAADDVPNPVGDRPGGRLCDVIPRDSPRCTANIITERTPPGNRKTRPGSPQRPAVAFDSLGLGDITHPFLAGPHPRCQSTVQ